LIELILRIGFSLLVVMGLLWGLARVIRRPLGVGRHHGPLAVLNRQQLTRASAVTVVRVGDRAMILGVTDQHVSLLGEADLEEFEKFEKHAHPRRDHLTVDEVPPPEEEAGALPAAHPVPVRGRLDGSLLSPGTWTATVNFLRDRTTRR
jgi:flagellar protein FliO/FliZ